MTVTPRTPAAVDALAFEAPICCLELTVLSVLRLSPGFLRLTLGGPQLREMDGGGELGPRDLRVKLLVPRPGGSVRPVVDVAPGWYPRWLAEDPQQRGEMRTYTVRAARFDGPLPEIDVDVVLHQPSGPASDWAAGAAVGDGVVVLGPACGRLDDHGGIDWATPAPEEGEVLLVGDETAVPAIGSILETLPAGYRGRALLEVARCADFLDVRTPADVEVTWLPRCGWPRGDVLLPMLDHVGTPAYAWLAGEASVVRRLRRRLVRGGVGRDRIELSGYWREGGPL